MPPRKRSRKCTSPSPLPNDGEQADDLPQRKESCDQQQREDGGDSDGSSNPSGGEEDELVLMNLADIRKEFQCPICLGIIKKTRTVMECLHRFCRACIDKAMRIGNNECPACRTHCASRRSLRDDPNYDALIAALIPDIARYEAEEMVLHEDDKNLSTQIQASIAETFRRQAKAQGRKQTSGKAASSATARRHRRRQYLRRGKRHRDVNYKESDEEEGTDGQSSSDDEEGTDGQSPADEHRAARKYKRRKKWSRGQTSQHSFRTKADDNNDSEANGEAHGSGELVPWGRARTRTNNRHAGRAWARTRLNRSDRIEKLVNHLQAQNGKLVDLEKRLLIHTYTYIHEFLQLLSMSQKVTGLGSSCYFPGQTNISMVLVPLKGGWGVTLARPYVSCSAGLTVRQLCEYVEMLTGVPFNIELLIVKDVPAVHPSALFEADGTCKLSPSPNELEVLDDADLTMGEIHCKYFQRNLVLAYRKKLPSIFWLKDTC